MLVLVLLGVSGVFGGEKVIDLSQIPSFTIGTSFIPNGQTAKDSVVYTYNKGTDDSVAVVLRVDSTTSWAKKKVSLTFKAGVKAIDSVIVVKGAAPDWLKVDSVEFTPAENVTAKGLTFLWRGGKLKRTIAATSKDELEVASNVTRFLTRSAGIDSVHLLDGEIESYAKVIRDSVTAARGWVVGGSKAGTLTLTSKGTGSPVLRAADDDSVLIFSPGSNSLVTIKSENGPAIVSAKSVRIGEKGSTANGVLRIQGWTGWSGKGAVDIATGTSAAIVASGDDSVVVFGRGGKTEIGSSSRNVIQITGGGNLKLDETKLSQNINGSTENASVIYTTTGNVELTGVTVDSKDATTEVAGQLVNAGGRVFIDGGTFVPASGVSGNAIYTLGTINIRGAKITSNKAWGSASQRGYVLEGDSVLIEASPIKDAYIGFNGSKDTDTIGGVKAGTAVRVLSQGNYKATVEVGKGFGTGIFVSQTAGTGAEPIIIQGDKASAYVTVATGKAIDYKNDASTSAEITLENAIIKRTSSTVLESRKNLIDVSGANVTVIDKSTDIQANSATSTAISTAIFVTSNTNVPTGVGGTIVVQGGSIAGAAGAIDADSVVVAKDAKLPGEDKTLIKSTAKVAGNVTIRSKKSVIVNNGNAKIINVAGEAGTELNPGAIIHSLNGNIAIYNVDSLYAGANATDNKGTATGLKTSTKGESNTAGNEGSIFVSAGYIKTSGNTISGADSVVIDYSKIVLSNGSTKKIVKKSPGGVYSGDSVEIGSATAVPKKPAIITNGTAAYSTISGTGIKIRVGRAKVSATGSQAAAIKDTVGSVFVNDTGANISSSTGNGIYVLTERSGDVGIKVEAGTVTSGAATNAYAAIYAIDANVEVGKISTTATGTASNTPDGFAVTNSLTPLGYFSNIISDNGALGIFATGVKPSKVDIGSWAKLKVTGTGKDAGAVRVTGSISIDFGGNLEVEKSGSLAFSLRSDEGVITVNDGKIVSQDNKEGAIKTTGGEIRITGGNVRAKSGLLVFAKDSAGRAGAGTIRVSDVTGNLIPSGPTSYYNEKFKTIVLNERGTAIHADGKIEVGGKGTLIETWTDTAISAGTAAKVGEIEVKDGATVQASGADVASKPIALHAKKVRLSTGAKVFANTERASEDDREAYTQAFVTGVVIPKRSGEGELTITGSGTLVRAYGSGIAVDNRDSTTTVVIDVNQQDPNKALNPNGATTYGLAHGVELRAGSGGIALKSVGDVTVEGDTTLSSLNETSRETGFNVHIIGGNGANSRAISMPVSKDIRRRVLNLHGAIVEAGSDGAIAIETGAFALDSLIHSVVLVRHGSTGVSGAGGVYIDGSYIEVLATEANKTGTAVIGNEINISGGGVGSKSEIHAKGIAVKDTRTTAGVKVQVTEDVHLTGTLGTDVIIGSSTLGKQSSVTPGAGASQDLWKISTFSDLTSTSELGKTLVVPAGITVSVTDNGSLLGTGASDTIKVAGVVTTVGDHAGATFINNGKVIVENGGNIKFNKKDANSFKQNTGSTIVLKTGSKLDDSLLVHDTGSYQAREYTFLKAARLLSGDTVLTAIGSRGPGKVIVPPLYAVLYNPRRLYVSEEDRDEDGNEYWDVNSKRTDTVYTARVIKLPLDRRYANYLQTADYPAVGNYYILGTGDDIIRTEDGEALFVLANSYNREAKLTNEAGTGTKTYFHTVLPTPATKIAEWQRDGSTQIFFDGFFNNADLRIEGHTENPVLVRKASGASNDVVVAYTGNSAKLLDGVKGAIFKKYVNADDPETPIYFEGLGKHQFWYKGVEGTIYPLTSNVPTDIGIYEIYASFAAGTNFERVGSEDKSIVYIGKVEIGEGDIVSIFNKQDNDSYIEYVYLEGKKAASNVKVRLPSVRKFSAAYDANTLTPSGSGTAAFVRASISSTVADDSTFTFDVNANSNYGEQLEFSIAIVNTATPGNIAEPQFIHVIVSFLSPERMKVPVPMLTVNYRDEKLTGLLTNRTYTFNGAELKTDSSTTPILSSWEGTTLKVVLQPGENENGMRASDTAKIVIAQRPEISDELKAISPDSVSTEGAANGRIRGTTVAMEYKLSTSSVWIPASDQVTLNLTAGKYNVRLRATDSTFASPEVTVEVFTKVGVSVAQGNREVPTGNVTTEAAVAPVKVTASLFTAGPSPVSKAAGEIGFFSSKAVKSGNLYIFDANGKTVAKAKVSGNAGKIGSANVSKLAEGSYVVKGALVGKDGTKSKVSFVFSVVK